MRIGSGGKALACGRRWSWNLGLLNGGEKSGDDGLWGFAIREAETAAILRDIFSCWVKD